MSPYLTTPPRSLEQACADLGPDYFDYAPAEHAVRLLIARLETMGMGRREAIEQAEINERESHV